jgi:DNA primase
MPGVFDQAVVSRVLQANDIVDIVGEHVGLKRKGKEMVGLCPFHDDHRPSLYVNPAKQIFKCFACGAGGSVFTFVQMRENLTFPQAVERLADRAGIRLKTTKSAKVGVTNQYTDIDPNKLAKVNAWATRYFQKNLCDGEKGGYTREYLAGRQISFESIKKWQLGLAVDSSDDLIRAAKSKNIPTKLLEQTGLITAQNQDKFVNRLMFPIVDVTGRIIGFGGRALSDVGAKYINSPTTVLFDKSNSLYGLEQARHQIVSMETAIVVEGYTDCIMAHQFGCNNVVATLGTSFTVGHGRLLRRYAKRVVLVFDTDTAGLEAANRALEVCLSQRIDIKLAFVPEGKDPCDFLVTSGKDAFEQLVDEAVDVFQFKWNRLIKRISSDETLVGRRAVINEYLQTVATAMLAGSLPAIDRGLIINRLSKIVGLDSQEINAELNRRTRRAARTLDYAAARQNVKDVRSDVEPGLYAVAEQELLEILLNEPGFYEAVRKKIGVEFFQAPLLKQIASIVFEALNNDVNVSLAQLLSRAELVDVSQCITELAQTGQKKGNFQSRLAGVIDVLERRQAEREKQQTKATDDQIKFLRHVCETTGKGNPHNIGLVR